MRADQVDRRWHHRLALRLSVLVRGRDPDGSAFDELAVCENASDGGVSLLLRHAVRRGQLLHLSLPLPSHLRQHDLTDPLYRVYAQVRSVVGRGEDALHVGLFFCGRTPPQGEEGVAADSFLLPADAETTAPHDGVPLMLRLAAEHAPGVVERWERALGERIRMWAARVRIRSLPAMKGAIVLVGDGDWAFRTRAEVRHIAIGADGSPRLDLAFLDTPAPPCLLTGAEAGAGAKGDLLCRTCHRHNGTTLRCGRRTSATS